MSRVLFSVTLGIVMLAGAHDAGAQVVNFRHYTNAEGLPQSQVLAIKQDRLGYLWFATYGGLSRFNGSEFHTYTKEDGLASNSVWDITEGRDGRLIVATSGGVCTLDGTRLTCQGQKDGLVSNATRSVSVDSAGGVWVGTARGVAHLSKGKIRNYTTADGLPTERVLRVVVDSSNTVWVATEKGLARLVGQRFVPDTLSGLGTASIQFIAPAGRSLLVGVQGHLYLRHGDSTTAVAQGEIPEGTSFVDGAVDRDGTMWVATRAGALRIRDHQVAHFGKTNGLSTDLLNRVHLDREGNVWFGTESGASKHVPGPFRTYTDAEGLPSPFVRAISVDHEGRLWTGTRNGVAVREGERFTPIPLPGVIENRVYGLAREPGGGMLIGTRRGLVHYRNSEIRVYHEQDGLPGPVVYCFAEDGRGGVWIGTDRGLAHWENGRITAVDRVDLAKSSIISMARDSRGRLWMGRLAGGMAVLDGDSVRLPGAEQNLTDQTVWALREDSKGRMWAATNGDGALRIDDNGIRRFTMKDGLASNFVWQVLPDSRGDIWLFGNLGLNRISGDRITHYGRGSGLIELEGSAGASLEDASGMLWLGTGSGLVRYEPGLDVIPDATPPIYIEEATQDGQAFPMHGARVSQSEIRIRFASPSFRDESAIRFRYRLMGANSIWSNGTAERSITYAGLGPGTYRFEAVAVNRAGRSAVPASLSFEVLPMYWQTWWFRLIAVSLLLGAAAAVPAWRARALERERKRLEALVAQHTSDLKEKNFRLAQSNRDLEHFAYVASHDLQEPLRKIQAFSDRVTKLYSEKLDEQGRDYLSRMGGAAARMQRLIEDLLSLSRVTTKRNPIEPLDLGALVQEVIGDLEFRIQSTDGRVEVSALPRIEGDPVQIRQVFQNLIGNALKFHRPEEKPVVRVSAVSLDANTVELRIEDNGIGFESKDAEKVFLPFQRLHGRTQYEGTGIGLTICQKIVERHRGTIRAESTPGKGTRFIVTLPTRVPLGERNAA